jgi:hypothetical protein
MIGINPGNLTTCREEICRHSFRTDQAVTFIVVLIREWFAGCLFPWGWEIPQTELRRKLYWASIRSVSVTYRISFHSALHSTRHRSTNNKQTPWPEFAERGMSHSQCGGSLRPYTRFPRPKPLLCLPSSSSVVLTSLNGLRSRPTTSQNIW